MQEAIARARHRGPCDLVHCARGPSPARQSHLVCASGGAATRAHHLPAFVCRRIDTDTYLRRMFVTEQLAALMGADDVVGAIAVDVAVLDEQYQAWPCVFTH